MTLLGIESSCDETGAAVLKKDEKTGRFLLLSNIIASSLSLHAKTGGIIPEVAAREQLKYILPVIDRAIEEGFGFTGADKDAVPPIDAIAVTVGPGLIGSLLVGVETARTLSYLWDKPLIPVNHLYGHIYANWIDTDTKQMENGKWKMVNIQFPALALVVSGGHTDIVLMRSHSDITVAGGTRDDAAGEAFDKIGRLLSLPYPAGPFIAKLAESGDPKRFRFPRPLIGSDDFDFSFSGLKTAVMRTVQSIENPDEKTKADIAASTEHAIVDILVRKTLKAAAHYDVRSILLGGGVAANEKLKRTFEQKIKEQLSEVSLFIPPKHLCTDNAAMIAAAGGLQNSSVSWKDIHADPDLYFRSPV